MTVPPKLIRTVRGKRPKFYSEPASDLILSMIMVLAQEHCVLRTQFNAMLRAADALKVPLAAEVEKFVPDDTFLKEQESWRQSFFERLFYLLHQDAAEVKGQDTTERFEAVLRDIAKT